MEYIGSFAHFVAPLGERFRRLKSGRQTCAGSVSPVALRADEGHADADLALLLEQAGRDVLVEQGNFRLTFAGPGVGLLSGTGSLTIAEDATVTIGVTTGTLIFRLRLHGDGTLTKTGPGVLKMDHRGQFRGHTLIEAGVMNLHGACISGRDTRGRMGDITVQEGELELNTFSHLEHLVLSDRGRLRLRSDYTTVRSVVVDGPEGALKASRCVVA